MQKASSRKRRPLVLWISISIAVIFLGMLFFTRSYLMAAYSLPTSSMEQTIHVNGKVLATKINYLPISRGDITVFHFPHGDTVIDLPQYQSMRPYYEVILQLGQGNADSGRKIVLGDPEDYPLVIRPVSKRETYLKRCVAIAGDTLQMKDEWVYINGRKQAWPQGVETDFRVVTNGQPLDEDIMKSRYGLDISNDDEFRRLENGGYYMRITWTAAAQMQKDSLVSQIAPDIDTTTMGVFPFDEIHHWSRDNYGPLWVPKKGALIRLTALNYSIYGRIIRTYEASKLEMHDGKIYLNDREANSYTFKMNYYWMLGDNLHGSQDSRYWGFVPEDHLIGKVVKIM